jgi:hypothetical protein
VPGNLFSLKQKQARGNVPGESLIGILLSVYLCIYKYPLHPGPGLVITMDHWHAPSPVSFAAILSILIYFLLCLPLKLPAPIKFKTTFDHFHAPSPGPCYVNRFVGSFHSCLTQYHPKTQQNGSHKIPYVNHFVIIDSIAKFIQFFGLESHFLKEKYKNHK